MAILDKERLPEHVAIIMDGNGRWAKKRKLPRVMGHNAGMQAMKKIVISAAELGIRHLTVYAFSTENWKRSDEEVGGIFNLLVKYVDNELDELCNNNVKVNILGDWTVIPQKARKRKAPLRPRLPGMKNPQGQTLLQIIRRQRRQEFPLRRRRFLRQARPPLHRRFPQQVRQLKNCRQSRRKL